MAAVETVAPRRDYIAAVVCPECGDFRVINARSARRIRAGQGDGRCQTCRTMARVQVTEVERQWARDMLDAMTPNDRALVLLAFGHGPGG